MANRLRAPARLLGFVAGVAGFVVVAGGIRLWPGSPADLRRRIARIQGATARALLAVLGIRVETWSRERPRAGGRGELLVCNHLSYVDALVLAALEPVTFVTSVETRELPVLGRLATLAGCLFVERRSRAGIPDEVDAIARAMRGGAVVVVFPEATSTDGSSVLPFKKSMFESALRAEAPVRLACLDYGAGRDFVAWYGDMGFVPHFARLLMAPSIRARVGFLGDLPSEARQDRTSLALTAWKKISVAYASA